jgi:hypothetical protein
VLLTQGKMSRRWASLLVDAFCVDAQRVAIWTSMKRRFEEVWREGTPIDNPAAYFSAMLKKQAERAGVDWRSTWPKGGNDPMGSRTAPRGQFGKGAGHWKR